MHSTRAARCRRLFPIALTLAIGLALTPAAAFAAPNPDSGPIAGGTAVTVDTPEGIRFSTLSATGYGGFGTTTTGETLAWGVNSSGQLGDGSTADSLNAPVQVQTPPGVTFVTVSGGNDHGVAIGSDGQTYAWGSNRFGQLGTNSRTDSLIPTLVSTPPGVTFTSVQAGGDFCMALGSDGLLYAWGQNAFGQLGIGSTTDSLVPVPVSAPPGVTYASFSVGSAHFLAVGSDGNLYAAGNNNGGQLGDNTTTQADSPIPVTTPPGIQLVTPFAGVNNSAALDTAGDAYTWGTFSYFGGPSVPEPLPMPAGVSFTSLTGGQSFEVATGSDGNTYAWGGNFSGQLGIGDPAVSSSATPLRVQAPAGVEFTQIDAFSFRTYALGSDGLSYGWGYNQSGELLDGTTDDAFAPALMIPVTVTDVSFDALSGTSLTQIDTGTWQVTTPAHPAGPVDVTVSWTQLGRTGAPEVYANGFTYIGAPTAVAPSITTTTLPAGTVGTPYSTTIEATGTGPITFAVTSGALPPGWTIDADTGVISGTATSAGDFSFTITATNGAGTDSRAYTTTITTESAAPTPSPTSQPPVADPPVADPPDLAATGAEIPWTLIGGAFALVVGGSGLFLAARRTRRG